jgi:ABC-type glycerol-3-phosphate transport system permease component
MPVIPVVGRKSFKTRVLIGALYAILILGAVTMIYPFALMLSTATTSNGDWDRFNLVPRYWIDRPEQFRKYVIDKAGVSDLAYEYGKENWFVTWDLKARDFRDLMQTPERSLAAMDRDFQEFMAGLDGDLKHLNFVVFGDSQYSVLTLRRDYFEWVSKKYGGNLDRVNRIYNDTAAGWEELGMPQSYNGAWESNPTSPRHRDWREFVVTRPYSRQKLVCLDRLVFLNLLRTYGGVDGLNRAHGTTFRSLLDVRWKSLARSVWGRETQVTILRREIPLDQIRLRETARIAFGAFAKRVSPGTAVPFSSRPPLETAARGIWIRFVQSDQCKGEYFDPIDPLELWRKFLTHRYPSVDILNTTYGTHYGSLEEARLPWPAVDYAAFARDRSQILRKFLLGNFQMVINYVLIHGRAMINTLILIVLTIGAVLTVNPMAAYVMSRFRLKYAHHILVFLLATMAFPAEVGMIPGFLLVKSFPVGALVLGLAAALMFVLIRVLLNIRLPLFWSVLVGGVLAVAAGWYLPPVIAQKIGRQDLNVSLMNTFFALVLPGLASGFSIFLLKGFFDSLPPELYEAAMLDGATEPRMFLSITIPMCKPVLAVTALGAFASAYGSFMFAFLTCQDPSMWTLMVFLYQFQQIYSIPLVMASLVVASIPTLIVFIFCQNMILRGIVIPTFK